MPKADEAAREARRRAEARISAAYGWPDRRTRGRVDWRVAVIVVLAFGIALVALSGWHL